MLNRNPIARLRWLCALAVCALALPLGAAVPGQVDFQGLLLDSGGQKVNGAVDLVFTLYDAPTGGTALWTESHPDVQVSDGVYGVTLGTTTPLTPALLGSGNVHLQISVEGETLTPRRQLLAVPYAIHAESAENIGSVGAFIVEQHYQYGNFDGAGPLNTDPLEGTADVDLDGAANFVDSDNDGDGLDDGQEVSDGTDLNAVTPVVTGVSPDRIADDVASVLVTVSGNNFDEPGLAVSIGGQMPVPTSVTATSFQVLVTSQAPGISPVAVSLGNGEAAISQPSFRFERVITVFTTSTSSDGNLGGIAGADARCAARASAAGLPGTFLARITDGVLDPVTRLGVSPSLAHFRDTTNAPLANFSATSGRTEFGATIPIVAGLPRVWAGSATADCEDWTSNDPGDLGQTVGLPGGSGGFPDQCHLTSMRISCFEQ